MPRPNEWKLGGSMELSLDEKLLKMQNEIDNIPTGPTVTVTAEYTQQTYNNKLASIAVDETTTDIYAPKVSVTPSVPGEGNVYQVAQIGVGSTNKTIYAKNQVNVLTDELTDGDHYIYTYPSVVEAAVQGGSIMAVSVLVEDQVTSLPTYSVYYLEKYWYVAEDPEDPYTLTYYAKFGNRTYKCTDPELGVFVLDT